MLKGETKGYRHHPQLKRFEEAAYPAAAISSYLEEVYKEGERRGYRFDRCKICAASPSERLPITSGQLKYEFDLLCNRLSSRDTEKYKELKGIDNIEPHPLFYTVEGGVAEWERSKVKSSAEKRNIETNSIEKSHIEKSHVK